MKKNYVLILCLVFPFLLQAQLDKLHPGMSTNEFHKNFPKAVPDLLSMTSSMYKQDTLLGIRGESRYVAVKDSVNEYTFHSVFYEGPSVKYPKADSAEMVKLVRAAQELTGHYSDIFGQPTETKTNNPRTKGNETAAIYSASWKKPDASVSIIVHPEIEIENEINAPAVSPDKKKKSTNYILEISAKGNGTRLRIDFEIGVTKNQFRALMPALASQVKDFPDCWMMPDTLAGRDCEWHFWFVDNGLAGFSFDSYNGDTYGGTNKAAYPLLLNKAKQLVAEEQKSYGSPTVLQAPETDAYVPVKKVPNAFFFDDIYYNAEWEMNKGKVLFIRLHESGGKGESFLHLEVYYGEKKE
jgi:hypothetical protein